MLRKAIYIKFMNNEVIHNFCESRLNNNNPPEIFNAYTSFFITLTPLLLGLPVHNYFYKTSICLILNGFASFYYHYQLNFFGKQADEITMILSAYYFCEGLLKQNYQKNSLCLKYNLLFNQLYFILFIIFNIEINFDFLFPYIFSIYIFYLLFIIFKVSNINNITILPNLSISFLGAIFWYISEFKCNEITQYGHILWHLLFPLGFYRIMLDFDKIETTEENDIMNEIL